MGTNAILTPELDDNHIYRVGGEIIPGFTEISTAMGLVDFWNRDPWYLERGRIIHKATELIDKGALDWTTVHPDLIGYLEAYATFKEQTGITWTGGETPMYHPQARYCGTPDRWTPLYDIKTGQGDVIQLEAYAELLKCSGIPAGREGYLLNLNDNGTYNITRHQYDRTLRYTWLAAVNVYHYRKQKGTL